MTEAIGNEKNNYTFSRKDGLYMNFDVILHIVMYWPLMGLGIYMGVSHPNVYIILLSIIACVVLVFSSINLYLRWRLFKIEESASLSINGEHKAFTYKHNDIVVDFNPNDIENWYWHIYHLDPVNCALAEIVEIRLKNGKKVIVSNGIGPVWDFFRENWKEFGMPEGKRSTRSLLSYMKEMEEFPNF